ncbi:MAG: hypothetical protein ABI778_03910, partial [Ignavibacteriota bacterium]
MTSSRSMLLGLVLGGLLSALSLNVAYAQVPRSISYQGLLVKNNQPVNAQVNLHIIIYDAANNKLYEESANGVQVTNGLFNVLLGGNSGTLPQTLKFDEQYYLGIDVDNTGELPHTPFVAAPYALNSQTVGGFGVSVTPQAGKLLPLDANGKIPSSVLPLSTLSLGTIDKMSGDSTGNVKIMSDNINTLRVIDDFANNTIHLLAVGGGGGDTIITNYPLTGGGVNKTNFTIGFDKNATNWITPGMLGTNVVRGVNLDQNIPGLGLYQDALGNLNVGKDSTLSYVTPNGPNVPSKPFGGVGLNLAKANTWTGLQTFAGGFAASFGTIGTLGVNSNVLTVNGLAEPNALANGAIYEIQDNGDLRVMGSATIVGNTFIGQNTNNGVNTMGTSGLSGSANTITGNTNAITASTSNTITGGTNTVTGTTNTVTGTTNTITGTTSNSIQSPANTIGTTNAASVNTIGNAGTSTNTVTGATNSVTGTTANNVQAPTNNLGTTQVAGGANNIGTAAISANTVTGTTNNVTGSVANNLQSPANSIGTSQAAGNTNTIGTAGNSTNTINGTTNTINGTVANNSQAPTNNIGTTNLNTANNIGTAQNVGGTNNIGTNLASTNNISGLVDNINGGAINIGSGGLNPNNNVNVGSVGSNTTTTINGLVASVNATTNNMGTSVAGSANNIGTATSVNTINGTTTFNGTHVVNGNSTFAGNITQTVPGTTATFLNTNTNNLTVTGTLTQSGGNATINGGATNVFGSVGGSSNTIGAAGSSNTITGATNTMTATTQNNINGVTVVTGATTVNGNTQINGTLGSTGNLTLGTASSNNSIGTAGAINTLTGATNNINSTASTNFTGNIIQVSGSAALAPTAGTTNSFGTGTTQTNNISTGNGTTTTIGNGAGNVNNIGTSAAGASTNNIGNLNAATTNNINGLSTFSFTGDQTYVRIAGGAPTCAAIFPSSAQSELLVNGDVWIDGTMAACRLNIFGAGASCIANLNTTNFGSCTAAPINLISSI